MILFSSALKEIHAVFGKTPGWCPVWSNFVQLLGCFLPLRCPHQFSRQARQASQQQVNYEQFTNHFPSNTCQFEIRVCPRKPTNVQNLPCLFWHMYQVFNCITGFHKVSILTKKIIHWIKKSAIIILHISLSLENLGPKFLNIFQTF